MKTIIDQINQSPYMLYLTVTGGGQSFINEFMKYGGASKTIAGCFVPYHSSILESFLNKKIEKFCTIETALLMATRSYEECLKTTSPDNAIGIGVSCSLATINEREGRQHKLHIALHGSEYTKTLSAVFNPGSDREFEEIIVKHVIFQMLASYCDVNYNVQFNNETFDYHLYFQSREIRNYNRMGYDTDPTEDNIAIFPGSWNPIHDGHREIVKVATDILGYEPYLELTINNADKGCLNYVEVDRRLNKIGYKTLLTNESTFLGKAKLFAREDRQIIFVVGVDTWNRILDPKYAGDMPYLYNELSKLNVRFLVFHRVHEDGMLSDELMNKLLISDKRTNEFFSHYSSTAIRNGEISGIK